MRTASSVRRYSAVDVGTTTRVCALAEERFLPEGGVLAFPCFHMYGGESSFQKDHGSLSATMAQKLKGRDHDVARAAIDSGLSVSLQPYLVESCADQTWQLQRFPTVRERDSLGSQLDPDGTRGSSANSCGG